MFPAGLSMLWERTDAPDALRSRFGFADLDEVRAWLTALLERRWGISVADCERVVISDQNAIAWLGTDAGPLVVKACVSAPAFDRLLAIADVVRELAAAGVPVAAPLPSRDGASRVVADASLPLSVVVQPAVDGELLDPADAAAVRAAGAVLARLHAAVAPRRPGILAADPVVPEPDLRRRLGTGIAAHASERAPRAAARLRQLLADLPDLATAPQLVHNDYRGPNVVMSGARVAAVLDFDEMTVDHRVADVARAVVLLATRFTSWSPAPAAARAHLLDGYRSLTPFTALEEDWLEAATLSIGLRFVPPGDDPDGWVDAVEHGL